MDFNSFGALFALAAAPTIAVITSSFLAGRSARKAQNASKRAAEDANQAQLGILRAASDASIAQKQAAEAAAELVRVAKKNDNRLYGLENGQKDLKKVAVTTHSLVNSQRTVMLGIVASLARQVADLRPDDTGAAALATAAEREAEAAREIENHPLDHGATP